MSKNGIKGSRIWGLCSWIALWCFVLFPFKGWYNESMMAFAVMLFCYCMACYLGLREKGFFR